MAVIGYTNAGKSTLFNRLTGADVLSKDMLFATLDPTMRQLAQGSDAKRFLPIRLGDRQLPMELVEAFKSTLEEVVCADVLLHVHDSSSPLVAEEAADVSLRCWVISVLVKKPRRCVSLSCVQQVICLNKR